MKNILILIVLAITISSCIEDFDLKLPDAEPRLVVDGLITNKPGPYYIRLTKGKVRNITSSEYSNTESVDPVNNAVVVISDNVGQVDTLEYLEWDENEYTYDYQTGGSIKIIKDQEGNIINRIIITDPFYYNKQGFYKTSHLKGIPGKTYFLNVKYNEKDYVASAYMPPVPAIDSIGYILKKSEIIGKSDKYFPLLYFKEPQGIKNYYLIQLQNVISSQIGHGSSVWQFSILSDTYLEPYVNGLNVSTGYSPSGENYYPIYGVGDSIYVALSSLTKEGYKYYENLLDQFEYDGGAYKPTPASPPGNISNGGLGLFRATTISEKRTKIPDHINVNFLPMN
jgi:hypothetical protein